MTVVMRGKSPTSRSYILPNKTLIDLILRRVRAGKTQWNYAVCWKDVCGFGIQLAHVDWVASGSAYINK